MPPAPVPSVAEVDAIAAMTDAVARNRRITRCYHELSAAVAARAGAGANWCTFATWASRQAGQTIRGEDLARATDDVLGAPEVRERLARLPAARAAHAALSAAVGPALRRSADAVAIGNRKVFAEIGREFARWLATDARDLAAFPATLRDGEPPDGQRLLREAFAAYAEACDATDAKARAERLLLANLLVGLHEQTRLQPEIAAALNAAFDADAARQALLALVFPGPWLRIRARVARALGRPLPLDVAAGALVDAVRGALRVTLTETLMTLRLPGTVLRLGRDLATPYPAELARIEHAPLRAFLARVDPTPDGTARSGAVDWACLPDRMHFIAELFRCWHARAELFTQPTD